MKPSYGQTNTGKNIENQNQDDQSTRSPPLENVEDIYVPENEIINKSVTNGSNETDSDYGYGDGNTTTELLTESTTEVSTTDPPDTTPTLPYHSEFVADDFCLCDLKVSTR